MKKQFLILFAFISVLALSQVPQRFNKVIVTGDITSPKFIKTGSTVDSVLLGNGSARSVNSLKTDTTSISSRINLKEPLLPSTPSNPESRFLNGNKQWAEIVLGSGGYASNVYFTNLTSTIVGSYKQTSGTHELTETIASGTCNNNEVLIHTYLFEQPVGITTVDAGVWRFTMNSKINSNVGDSKFKIVQFRRSSTGVETDMFTIYSNTIENTDYQNFITETVQPSFLVDSLDHFGCRIYATTTTTVNKTISYKVGDGFASYLNTPLVPRHDQFRDKNGNPLYQHLTAAQVAKVNAISGTNTGDETLTSIKTKLGAASSVSDGYLKYQDFALLHTPTTVTASNGLSISGQNISLQNANTAQSGALTFNDWNTFNGKEPAITKNSGFNLPLGNTPGTVLEGRTFGTAANNAVGDFLHNLSVNTNTFSENGISQFNATLPDGISGYNYGVSMTLKPNNAYAGMQLWTPETDGNGNSGELFYRTGFGDNKRNWRKVYDDKNLTSSLSTNYLTKWNGSSLVNSLLSDDGNKIYISKVFQLNDNYQIQWSNSTSMIYGNGTNGTINLTGNIKVDNGTVSTSPTTGALVVNGGVGADHVRANNFYGNGSNLTGIQLPITLTTNGTSGAATFSGNVLNVPNYTSSGTGGSFTSTYTDISNTTLTTATLANYTNVNGVISASVIGTVTSTATGKCVFRVSLPTITNSSRSVVISGTDSGSTTATNCFVNGDGTNYVEIAFIAATSSSQFKFKLISMGI